MFSVPRQGFGRHDMDKQRAVELADGCVGREGTLAVLDRAVERGLRWIHVYGVGGVGKTTLVNAFTRSLELRGRNVCQCNGFFLQPAPTVVTDALFSKPREVYVLDTFERLQVLELWFAQRVLGYGGITGSFVTAGRQPLSDRLAASGSADGTIAQFKLENLSADAVAHYLGQRGIAHDRHPEIWKFSKGHPLALRVAAAILANDDRARFDIGDHPSALRFLMSSLLDQTPTLTHRRALEVLAVNRTTTEATLRSQLPEGNHREIFEWLCRLPITLLTPQGLAPHDLARQVLFAELSWRNPTAAQELATRAHIDAVERAATCPPAALQQAIGDAVFAGGLRWRGAIELEEVPECYPDAIRPEDDAHILDIVERHQGAASAVLVQYWLGRARERFLIGRGRSGQVVAFMLIVDHGSIEDADLAADPAVVEFDKLIHRRAASGGYCPVARFYLMQDAPFATENPGYHFLAEQLLVHLVFAREPTIGASVETAHIVENFAEAQVHQQAAKFLVGDVTFYLTFEDYRENPALDLIRMHNDAREKPRRPSRPSQHVEEEFESAVRHALKHYFNSEVLRENPLAESLLVSSEQTATEDSAAALRGVLERAVRDLSGAGGDDARQRRVLEATYLDAARPKQRAVAADLGMGYSTYRRHLRDATRHLTVHLRERDWSLRTEQERSGTTPTSVQNSSRARWGIVGRSG